LRSEFLRVRRRIALSTLIVAIGLVSAPAEAGSLFDFLFGSRQPAPPPQAANAYSNPFSSIFGNSGPGPQAQPMLSHGSGYCVRTCDGRYFPVTAQSRVSTAEMCEAFCPASTTRVYSGSSIDHAVANDGSRYRDSKNAYLFRERIVDNCTCNGRNSAGLAPIDLAMDPTLRKGDIVATTDGLYAYSGGSSDWNQSGQFTPIASYPGLSAELRTRLGEIKVTPAGSETSPPIVTGSTAPIRRAQVD
jgi:hypothetical protein